MTLAVARISRWARWSLGGAFLLFYLATVAMFFWGPWDYPLGDGRGQLLWFLAGVHLAFAAGYGLAVRGEPASCRVRIHVPTLTLVAVTVSVLLLFPSSRLNTGHWFPWPGDALRDLNAAYAGSLSLRETSRPFINYLKMFLAPLLGCGLPLAVVYWHRLPWYTRVLTVAAVVGTIALFVAMGANAGAGEWMAVFPWLLLAGDLSGVNRLHVRGWASVAGVLVLSIAIFATLFSATMNQRTGSFVKYGLPGVAAQPGGAVSSSAASTQGANPGAAPPAMPRSAARIGAEGLAGYLTQGYWAVHLSLQEPFVPMYGVGNSMFLQRQVARVLHAPDFQKRSYPERIQARGWNAYGYWATIYPWIASDVGFTGTVVVMGLIGWIVGAVWLDVLGGRQPLALPFFGQLLILLYYVPAHNKTMQSGEGVFGLWGLGLLWWWSRGRGSAIVPASDDVALAVVGTIAPDEPAFHGPAFNRAAQMFQAELIDGLRRGGLPDTEVFTLLPVPGFPRSRQLVVGTGTVLLAGGQSMRILPFFNVHPLKALSAGVSTSVQLMRWAWKHRRQRRIMHVINLTMPPGVFVWLAARLTGSVVTVSVLDVWKPGGIVPDTLARRVDYGLLRWLLPRLDGHMVVTPAIADDFLPGRPVCVLEGGLAPARVGDAAPAGMSVERHRFRIVLAGTLEPYNGVLLLRQAMAHLSDEFEVVVAGMGPLADDVAGWAASDPRVAFRGFLSFADTLDLYRSADLLLNLRITTDLDTRHFFPSKLLELVGSGVPVLSTCSGQIEAEYGAVVYLLREETPAALAQRLAEIARIDVAERRALGRRAREFILAEKTWAHQTRRLAAYLRDRVAAHEAAR